MADNSNFDSPHYYDLPRLLQAIAGGANPRYLFFWGHTPKVPGTIDKSCFSQWYDAPFQLNGITYGTAEHYMMAEKARLFGDAAALETILAARHPGAAKRSGRMVANFDDERWQVHRREIVVRGNIAKFSQNEGLKQYLLNTGTRVLVEASPVDTIWGIGLTADDVRAVDPERWQGLNLLGFALMTVRDILRNNR